KLPPLMLNPRGGKRTGPLPIQPPPVRTGHGFVLRQTGDYKFSRQVGRISAKLRIYENNNSITFRLDGILLSWAFAPSASGCPSAGRRLSRRQHRRRTERAV